MPVLQALTKEEMDARSPNGKWVYEDFRAKNHYLGKLIELTFSHVCTSVISIYGHLIFDHSAFFLKRDGPLGPWGQQAVENSHKWTKSGYMQATNHDGGHVHGENSSLSQILLRSMRLMVGELRVAASRPSADPNTQTWRNFIMTYVKFSALEEEAAAACAENTERRVRNVICRQMNQPDVADEQAEAAEAAALDALGGAEAEVDAL
jgi:hypothetical protein